jgi:hypothetical protein
MTAFTRRSFLRGVGQGMLIAGVGFEAAVDLGLASAHAADSVHGGRLEFGPIEPLVRLMQETPADKLLPKLAAELQHGVELKQLVAAAALANARTFGGQDYVGFHTMMALAPAYHMSQELTGARKALPVLKVLYRNTNRIGEVGGTKAEKLLPVEPAQDRVTTETLLAAVREKQMDTAERQFAAFASRGLEDAFEHLLPIVQDNYEVHRVVLPYRAWDLLGIIGPEHAHTLLRQSIRYCVHNESPNYHARGDGGRNVLPKLLEEYKLLGERSNTRQAEDAWVESLSRTIFSSTPEQAAEAVAAALGEGFEPDAIGEAISLATNQLVLRDKGRTGKQVQPGKPEGSVHGDSIGVHACDSANAWRNMARLSCDCEPRNAMACLILGAYQASFDRIERGGDFLHWQPYPREEDLSTITTSDPDQLLAQLDETIRGNDQARAAAIVAKCSSLDRPARPVFDALLKYAVSEDGALHAEKYYRTVSEEFAATRPAFRWRQLIALARVTASEYGRTAAGYDQSRELLGIG